MMKLSGRVLPGLVFLAAFSRGPGCTAQAGSGGTSFRVSGQVLSEHDHRPLAHAHLVLRRELRPDDGAKSDTDGAISADADETGRFTLRAPSAGWWQLTASARGFRSQLYNEHEGFSSAVILTSKMPTANLTMTLEPDSVVSGFVLDEAGEPVREAMVSLLLPQRELSAAAGGQRRTARTDDRGRYELAGVLPGEYRLSVQATPWYARSTARGRFNTSSAEASNDAAFDVVYPLTWYPGVTEERAAGEINLHGGDARQIDLTLVPLPAAHLRLPAVDSGSGASGRGQTTISRVDGPESYVSYLQPAGDGEREFGGLAPGLYRVTLPPPEGGDSALTTSFVEIQAGVSRLLTPETARATANVRVQLEGETKQARAEVTLTDVQSGTVFTEGSPTVPRLRRRPDALPRRGPSFRAGEDMLEVPPSRYYVSLSGGGDAFLTGVALNGVIAAGHEVTLTAGVSVLTLKLMRGRAQLSGYATVNGQASVGAMVMLVPASFGQPGSAEVLARDETNSDGSFEMRDVIPGDYILLAIDRGWGVNWHDPATLSRYLLRGMPLSLAPSARLEKSLVAQAP